MGSEAERSSETYLQNLIFGVCHLCERTRELATSGSRDPMDVQPLREAMDVVRTTLEALCATWTEGVPAALPAEGTAEAIPVEGWLLEAEDIPGSEDARG
jgi:hypothetical protein